MRGRPVFVRVYEALKSRLLAGAFAPGERLEPNLLADQLNASITPIRDALHRLAGEGLIQSSPEEEFRVQLLTEPALRDLYRWQEALLLIAIETREDERLRGGETSVSLDETATLFLDIGRQSSLAELVPVLARTLDRLAPVRVLEADIVDPAALGLSSVIDARDSGDRKRLRQEVRRYHRTRVQAVSRLLQALLARRSGF